MEEAPAANMIKVLCIMVTTTVTNLLQDSFLAPAS